MVIIAFLYLTVFKHTFGGSSLTSAAKELNSGSSSDSPGAAPPVAASPASIIAKSKSTVAGLNERERERSKNLDDAISAP